MGRVGDRRSLREGLCERIAALRALADRGSPDADVVEYDRSKGREDETFVVEPSDVEDDELEAVALGLSTEVVRSGAGELESEREGGVMAD